MTRPDGQSDVEFVQWALGGIDLGVDADMSALFQHETVIARLREALDAGVPPKQVWAAVWRQLELPDSEK